MGVRYMCRVVLAVFALALGFVPLQSAQAQGQMPNQCQNTIFQAVFPLISEANRFSPSGVFPQGYGPLTQPFGTSPTEGAIWGYPQQAYYSGYVARPYALPSVPGAPSISYQPGTVPLQLPPDELTPSAIMQFLIDSGTWDRLGSTEQADWLMRLAGLQRDQFSQYLGLANLQRDSQRDLVSVRRAPFEIAERYQERAQQWRASYGFTADALRNLLQTTCNPGTGQIGVGGGLNGVPGGLGVLPGVGAVGGPSGVGAACLVSNAPPFCPFR
jgi:hypothetical protein